MSRTYKSDNLTPGTRLIGRVHREECNRHRGGVLWMTGLSGSGKSTLAAELEKRLWHHGWNVTLLDGDSMRMGLNDDLGFSAEDRSENIRRAAEVAKLMAYNGTVVIASFITPTHYDRGVAYRVLQDDYVLVYLNAGLEVCEARDPKGLYVKARSGIIREFSGITAPYDIPTNPDLTVNTHSGTVEDSLSVLQQFAFTHFKR